MRGSVVGSSGGLSNTDDFAASAGFSVRMRLARRALRIWLAMLRLVDARLRGAGRGERQILIRRTQTTGKARRAQRRGRSAVGDLLLFRLGLLRRRTTFVLGQGPSPSQPKGAGPLPLPRRGGRGGFRVEVIAQAIAWAKPWIKVFWFFFSKKNCFLSVLIPQAPGRASGGRGGGVRRLRRWRGWCRG
jgi:hypothetical protein